MYLRLSSISKIQTTDSKAAQSCIVLFLFTSSCDTNGTSWRDHASVPFLQNLSCTVCTRTSSPRALVVGAASILQSSGTCAHTCHTSAFQTYTLSYLSLLSWLLLLFRLSQHFLQRLPSICQAGLG
jgi:hypothetical protein